MSVTPVSTVPTVPTVHCYSLNVVIVIFFVGYLESYPGPLKITSGHVFSMFLWVSKMLAIKDPGSLIDHQITSSFSPRCGCITGHPHNRKEKNLDIEMQIFSYVCCML